MCIRDSSYTRRASVTESLRGISVSYTHLDVYKRQVYRRTLRMLCVEGNSETTQTQHRAIEQFVKFRQSWKNMLKSYVWSVDL